MIVPHIEIDCGLNGVGICLNTLRHIFQGFASLIKSIPKVIKISDFGNKAIVIGSNVFKHDDDLRSSYKYRSLGSGSTNIPYRSFRTTPWNHIRYSGVCHDVLPASFPLAHTSFHNSCQPEEQPLSLAGHRATLGHPLYGNYHRNSNRYVPRQLHSHQSAASHTRSFLLHAAPFIAIFAFAAFLYFQAIV